METNNSLKTNLRYSTIEGSFWAFMFGMGENYLSALSVFLGYTAIQISLLNSIPQFIGSFCQLFSNQLLTKFKSIKKFVVVLSYFQAFLWILLIYIIFYFNNFWLILFWFIIYFTIAYLINPVWISWIGYLVPRRIRGTYHGIRNRNINFFILVAILSGGYILDVLNDNLYNGFLILFIIAFIGRILSSYYLSKKNEILKESNTIENNFIYFFNNKTTLIFIIFKFIINFSIMFLGALFAIYILRTLEMSNLILGYCGACWWAGNIVSSKKWGKLSKNKGNMYILKITTIIITILPLIWILIYYFNDIYKMYMILILPFLAGITFSGFSLSTFNIVYDIVNKNDVVKYTSLLRFSEGTGILLSSVIAGYIVDSIYINNILSNINFTTVQLSFSISMILRMICLLFLFKYEKKFIKSQELVT